MEVGLADGLSPQRSRIAKAVRCKERAETHRERAVAGLPWLG